MYSFGMFLLVLLGLTSCSDNPYTGSMMQPGDIDKYLSQSGGKYCLINGSDSTCVTLYPKREDQLLPIIHIHPSSTTLVFYYRGQLIMRAERPSDNTDLIEDLMGEGNVESEGGPRDDVGVEPVPPQQPGENIVDEGGESIPENNGGTNNEGTNNGGTNNGGNNNNGNNDNGNNDNGNNDNGNNNNNGGVTPPNNPNPSGHNPPDNVISHYVYGHEDDNPVTDDVNGWLIWIYYPHNYADQGLPRGLGMAPFSPQSGPASTDDPSTTDVREDYGFTFSVSGGEVTEFTQTSGPCIDNLIGLSPSADALIDSRAAGQDNRDDSNDTPCSSSNEGYSVQIYVEEDNPQDTGLSTSQQGNKKISLTIRWTHGMYAPQSQTFNIMREVSMKDWNMEGYDPEHTHQERWD